MPASHHTLLLYICIAIGLLLGACVETSPLQQEPVYPALQVSSDRRYLLTSDGTPFCWIGGTSWGMSEWMTREEVDLYLDDRAEKGFNMIQLCLFWGKREDHPVTFTTNPPNAYGFQAFAEIDGKTEGSKPLVVKGGSPDAPNDYWDHVDYIVRAAKQRGMFLAVLPVWGRRYVNATHEGKSSAVFGVEEMKRYGVFLGERYGQASHLIWVLGGDVSAYKGGDFLGHYRFMAEGLIQGITGEQVSWDEASPLWDHALMTYHPAGVPMKNSSLWFHQDPWLDFNMIETHIHVDSVVAAVQQDYELNPSKPTVMAEPAYEGHQFKNGRAPISSIQVRRQAYQSLFAGAMGFTYGGFWDEAGNGPLFSPFGNWQAMLDLEGAQSMTHLKAFCQDHSWPTWQAFPPIITSDPGVGEFRQVAVQINSENEICLYFPNNRPADLNLQVAFPEAEQVVIKWFDPITGSYSDPEIMLSTQTPLTIGPPEGWRDAVLCISR